MFDIDQSSYTAFRDICTERTTPLVAWIGAGPSAEAGLPSWEGLASILIGEAEDRARTNHDAGQRKQDLARIESIRAHDSLWVQFQRLRAVLGPTTYRELIRHALSRADTAPIPGSYKRIWKLNFEGLLNLNLDQLATRAFTGVFPGRFLHELNGREAAKNPHILRSPNPFIINLHGRAAEEESWVFTHDEREELVKQPGFQELITSILSTRTILFLGIRADDIAVGGHLERLRSNGIDFGAHYWITERHADDTTRWAERVGLRIIRYRAAGEDHGELMSFFDDLEQYQPKEPDAPPVAFKDSIDGADELPLPSDLLSLQDPDEIRSILNSRAKTILASDDEGAYERYEKFFHDYDEAIYRAWYVQLDPPKNRLLSYTLLGHLGEGAFGNVYRAKDESGREVAVKVLHEKVRSTPEMLQSFRRGVQSMRILADRGVEGMVPYLDASEIPAFVVMELIPGPDLKTAVNSRYVDDWKNRLSISRSLAKIIHSAHRLPERVLHRDLRPANIMLNNYYISPDAYEVVVLDFDLSYHLQAVGMSIDIKASSGYVAPEQVDPFSRFSRRNATVDSYGLGMTMYFMLAKKEPVFDQPSHGNWADGLAEISRHESCSQWVSLPRRYSRIVEMATKRNQPERWDLRQILGELERLEGAFLDPSGVCSAELLAEELIARSSLGHAYRWDGDSLGVSSLLASGLSVEVCPSEGDDRLEINVGWSAQGTEDRRRLGKWLPEVAKKCMSSLKQSGWTLDFTEKPRGSIFLTGHISNHIVASQMSEVVAKLNEVVEFLKFK